MAGVSASLDYKVNKGFFYVAAGWPGLPGDGHVQRAAIVPVKPLRIVGEADQLPRVVSREGHVASYREQRVSEICVAKLASPTNKVGQEGKRTRQRRYRLLS